MNFLLMFGNSSLPTAERTALYTHVRVAYRVKVVARDHARVTSRVRVMGRVRFTDMDLPLGMIAHIFRAF